MPHRPSDPGIPTLTQRAEPTLSPSTPPPDAPLLTEVAPERASAHDGDAFPLLTDVARHDDAFPLLTDVARDDDAFPLLTDVARDDDALPLLTDVARDDDAFPLLTDVAQDGADASRSAEAADTPALPPPRRAGRARRPGRGIARGLGAGRPPAGGSRTGHAPGPGRRHRTDPGPHGRGTAAYRGAGDAGRQARLKSA